MTPRTRLWLARRLNKLGWRCREAAVHHFSRLDDLNAIAKAHAIVAGMTAENDWLDRYLTAKEERREGVT